MCIQYMELIRGEHITFVIIFRRVSAQAFQEWLSIILIVYLVMKCIFRGQTFCILWFILKLLSCTNIGSRIVNSFQGLQLRGIHTYIFDLQRLPIAGHLIPVESANRTRAVYFRVSSMWCTRTHGDMLIPLEQYKRLKIK